MSLEEIDDLNEYAAAAAERLDETVFEMLIGLDLFFLRLLLFFKWLV
jgi:hypothetical protein